MKEFVDYLNERQELCLQRAKKLADEQCDDESILEKVRANIYGIYISLAQVPNKSPDYLKEKLEKIPAAWHESLARATEHNDHEKEAQEQVKIEVVEEIKAKLASLMEEERDG